MLHSDKNYVDFKSVPLEKVKYVFYKYFEVENKKYNLECLKKKIKLKFLFSHEKFKKYIMHFIAIF